MTILSIQYIIEFDYVEWKDTLILHPGFAILDWPAGVALTGPRVSAFKLRLKCIPVWVMFVC